MTKKKGISEAYLDQIFSIYIRLRDADDEGYITCCNYTKKSKVCQGRVFWKEATNGHFVKRSHRTLRWDERNCNAECGPCNQEDTNFGYIKFMEYKFGGDIWDVLDSQRNLRFKYTPYERKIMADNYKHKIKQLKKEKGL